MVPLQLPWWHASFAAFGIQTWICVPPQLDEMSPIGTCGEIGGDSLRYGEMSPTGTFGERTAVADEVLRNQPKIVRERPRSPEIARDHEAARDRPSLEMCRARTLSSLLRSLPNSQQTAENS